MTVAVTPTGGFETLHEILVLQLLALRGIVQLEAVSVPVVFDAPGRVDPKTAALMFDFI
jgi:hypothetical protein